MYIYRKRVNFTNCTKKLKLVKELPKMAESIFKELNADDADPETTEIESICMRCFETGNTRMMLTKIPFYKEVVLMSFACNFCGFENNEIQSAMEIQEKAVRISLDVLNVADLNRRVVRSDYTSVSIPEVDLEIPSHSQKGEITTIEGIIDRTIRGLMQDQDKRKVEHPDTSAAIEAFILRLNALKELKSSFSMVFEDITGNSFVENLSAPAMDPNCKTTFFLRTKEQDKILGLYTSEDSAGKSNAENKSNLLKPIQEDSWPIEELHGEVLQFQTSCPQCRAACETNMKVTNIPHFKDVVIMATVCDECGCKTNEVKSGGGIETSGTRFTVVVKAKDDLSRDVLKSDTCSLRIAELDCEVGPAALGGRFTTVEGILIAMKNQIEEHGVMFHDSSDGTSEHRFNEFIKKFNQILSLEMTATLILDDPAGNSYVQSLCDGDELDENLKLEKYERTFEQNDELGLNDMKTENYHEEKTE